MRSTRAFHTLVHKLFELDEETPEMRVTFLQAITGTIVDQLMHNSVDNPPLGNMCDYVYGGAVVV